MKRYDTILALLTVFLLAGVAATAQWSTNWASSAALRPEVVRASHIMQLDAPNEYHSQVSMTNTDNAFTGTFRGTSYLAHAYGLTTNFVGTNGLHYFFTNGVLGAVR